MILGTTDYQIISVDYWEQDAILAIGKERFYFQFSQEAGPTLDSALRYLQKELLDGLSNRPGHC